MQQFAPLSHRIHGQSRFVERLLGLIFVLIFLMPLITVFWLALRESGPLVALPRYALNSLLLVIFVGLLSLSIGLGAAFFVVRFEFRGRKWLETLLILPLALPAFLVAYALVEFLDYAGPLQTALRGLGLSWAWPKFRSIYGAILVLSFALYPYVYLYARQGLLSQSRHVVEAARLLGLAPWQVFWRIELPSLRPALAIGLSLVSLEVLADFGTVDHFGVETLSTGIFSAWLQAHQLGSAVRLALVLAILAMGLLWLESNARKNASYVSVDGRAQSYPRHVLGGWGQVVVWAFGLLPPVLGFFIPVGIFVSLFDWGRIPSAEWQALAQSIFFGSLAAILVVGLSLLLNRKSARRMIQVVALIGYALPGAVLGLGVMIPLTLLDHKIADWREAMGAGHVGLVLMGSGAAMVLAYVIRFFALGNGAISEGKARISPNLSLAARVLGQTRWQAFWRVERPLLAKSAMIAALLVFVDVIKELPATLILRPFGVETLATRLYAAAALEDLGSASLSALLIALTGLVSVVVLIRYSD